MNLGTPIAVGNTAQIFLYENKIVKVFKESLPDKEAVYEATNKNMPIHVDFPYRK